MTVTTSKAQPRPPAPECRDDLEVFGPARFRTRVKRCLHAGMYWSGGARMYTLLTAAPVATVLMYHSVPPPEWAPWIDPRQPSFDSSPGIATSCR
jgi:hypothetical protein